MMVEEINEAIQKVIDRCDYLKDNGYPSVSMRGLLEELGYKDEQVECVICHVYLGGFRYCLDSHLGATHFDPNRPGRQPGDSDMVFDYAEQMFCHWGPDQVSSRLRGLSNFTARNWWEPKSKETLELLGQVVVEE